MPNILTGTTGDLDCMTSKYVVRFCQHQFGFLLGLRVCMAWRAHCATLLYILFCLFFNYCV